MGGHQIVRVGGLRRTKYTHVGSSDPEVPARLPVSALVGRVRERVGPDYELITDPVCSYDLREALDVGRVLEELDFVWLQEPHARTKNEPLLGTVS